LLNQFYEDEQLFAIGGISESEFENSKLYLENLHKDLEILRKEIEISMLGLRHEDLIAAGITPAEDYDEFKKQIISLNCETADAMVMSAEATYENAEKNVISYQKLMDELVLKAKVSGIVGAHYFEAGEYVGESSKVFTLIDTDTVTTIFSIQESEITGFKIGSDVKIYIQSINSEFETKISEISPMVDSQSGNFTVKAELPNSNNLIKPGMFAKCVLPNGKQRQFLTLSEDCIVPGGDNNRVFTVINKILVEKELDVIHRKEGKIWFTDELNENSVVIKNPTADLQEGMVVEI
jgi:RND family efflux transporter MFP subunit